MVTTTTLEQRKSIALQARTDGYNCAQAVLMAFADCIDTPEQTLMALSAPLGAGVACGEICGVANAIAIAKGLILDDSSPTAKVNAMKQVNPLLAKFVNNNGAIRCADLKGVPGKAPCNDLILQGIEILHNDLTK